jgi:RHS repeat-associated protein
MQVQTSYYDGLGQEMQKIILNGATVNRDLIIPADLRHSKTKLGLLPYPAPATGAQKLTADATYWQQAYYTAAFPNEDGQSFSLSQMVDPGPAQLPEVRSYKPGRAYTGTRHGATITTRWNTSADPTIFILGMNTAGYPARLSATGYDPYMLAVTTTETAEGGKTVEYADREGKTVCKAARYTPPGTTEAFYFTYYIYDELGRISWVLPPKLVNALNVYNWVPSAFAYGACLDLGFCYKYDERNRLIKKSVPGRIGANYESDYMVYDDRGRRVLYQTPASRDASQWQFTIYDGLDRAVLSGMITSTDTREDWQSWLDDPSSVPGGVTPGSLLQYLRDGFTGIYPASIPGTTIDLFNYYDTYGQHPQLANRVFDNSFSGSYRTSAEAITPVAVASTHGQLVGTRVRVVSASQAFVNPWIATVVFYDENGRPIQTQTQNPWNPTNWDVATTQFDFQGKTIMQVAKTFGAPSSSKPFTTIVKNLNYELATQRLITTKLKIDAGPWTKINGFVYDNLGRVATKQLGSSTEVQNYDYSIGGELRGINSAYANDAFDPDGNITFGCSLKAEAGFDNPRLDGSLSGIVWRGAGGTSTYKRAYGYSYDQLGRLTTADFREYPVTYTTINGVPTYFGTWDNNNVDYSVSNIGYDENGNIASMKQKGVQLGGGPVTVDDLAYAYNPETNRLIGVEDANTTNYGTHDFQDNSSHGQNEYGYDHNGNLTRDDNKGITAITYNFIDLPLVITTTTGSVEHSYDGTGLLLSKKITHPGATPGTTVIDNYDYWGPFVFLNGTLQYILHEDGRFRADPATGALTADYFVKDHLGNVRTVVTPVVVPIREYLATMEIAVSGAENLLFEHIDDVREQSPSSISPQNTKAAALTTATAGKDVGTAIVLKVMAGDKFDVKALAYQERAYQTSGEPESSEVLLSSIVSALVGAPGGAGGGEGGGSAAVVNSLFSTQNFLGAFGSVRQQTTDPTRAPAYLNYLSFDENMRLIPEKSGAIQVGSAANSWEVLEQTGITIGHNGYIAIMTTNEDIPLVYFDNVQVTHHRGQVLEEMHYYPFGLTIRSPNVNPQPNKFWYQGKELSDDLGLEFYDFHARLYDPQIGRFWGIDPADQFPSGYTGMGNDPGNMTDPSGMLATGWGQATDAVVQTGTKDRDNVLFELLGAPGSGIDDWDPWAPTGRGGGAGGGDVASGPENATDNTNTSQTPNDDGKTALAIEIVTQEAAGAAAATGIGLPAAVAIEVVGGVAALWQLLEDVTFYRPSTTQNSQARQHATSSTTEANTSNAARREAMRKEGIPTSQQPKAQRKTPSGREYDYDVPKDGGGSKTKSVQQRTLDRGHENEPHWEAGDIKIDPRTGQPRFNQHGSPKMINSKSKVIY